MKPSQEFLINLETSFIPSIQRMIDEEEAHYRFLVRRVGKNHEFSIGSKNFSTFLKQRLREYKVYLKKHKP